MLYFYGPQRAAVAEIFGPVVKSNVVRSIDRPEQLAGLKDVCWISVVGHLSKVPARIEQVLQERGVVRISIDDFWRRKRTA